MSPNDQHTLTQVRWMLRLHSLPLFMWATESALSSPHFSHNGIFALGNSEAVPQTTLASNTPLSAVHILKSTQKQHGHPLWEDTGMRFSSNPRPSSTKPRTKSTSHAHKLLTPRSSAHILCLSFLQPAILATCPTLTEPAPGQRLFTASLLGTQFLLH